MEFTIANRLVEPWTWTQQIASAADVENFIWLRDHHMAEPHFAELAGQMHAQLIEASRVFDRLGTNDLRPYNGFKNLQVTFPGDWHLLLIQPEVRAGRTIEGLKMISAACCARVSSFLPENGRRSDIARDLELFHRVAGFNPKHLSPLEHLAMAMRISAYAGNFEGFLPVQEGDLGRGWATMSLHAVHIDLTLRVAAIVAAFFVLIAAFLAIDAERIIRRLDDNP